MVVNGAAHILCLWLWLWECCARMLYAFRFCTQKCYFFTIILRPHLYLFSQLIIIIFHKLQWLIKYDRIIGVFVHTSHAQAHTHTHSAHTEQNVTE